jgi:hypothetical protein
MRASAGCVGIEAEPFEVRIGAGKWLASAVADLTKSRREILISLQQPVGIDWMLN